ncbi:hemerythrin domain-containing protein [Streptomyces sp. NBC_01622]|uniref:hemerythrin domain-containing protein n=1 Tax=Streptomyces sp. NBC_01622 TaxID=2975903 RepID=UPI00386C0ECC|nr:hemerythrin domain-containing protein [Streptomyces sp. NBC_01622]
MADVRDMYMIHTVFRREFGLMPGLVRGVADGDTERSEIVGAHLDLMCRFLHVHHEGEDVILWPLLLERGGESTRSVVPTMQSQHAAIEAALGQVTESLSPWRRTAREAAALADACESLNASITVHMALEEEQILPLAEKLVTHSEWKQLGAHGRALFTKQEFPVCFGMAMYEADREVTKSVLADAPFPVRLLAPRLAPRAFAAHSRRVHGTATPPRAASLT